MPCLRNIRRSYTIPLHNKLKMQEENKQKSQIISWNKNEGLMLYDIKVTYEILTIAIVYFIQGLFSICGLALSFYYKDVLNISPAELSVISSISAIPWMIKPLYGFISDSIPFFGYKRKSYLILSGITASTSWLLLANLVTMINNKSLMNNDLSTYVSVFLVTLSSLGLAFSDVIVDAIVVKKSREQNKAGSLQSICWTFSSIGRIISAYFSGYLLENYGTTFVFYLTASIPLIMIITSLLIEEKRIETKYENNLIENMGNQIHNIKDVIKNKSVLYPFLFLIIWNVTPSMGSSLFYFEVNELGFTPEFFGRIGLFSSISSLFGIMIYNQKLKNLSLHKIFKWTCITGTVLGMSPIILVTHANRLMGIPDKFFAILDSVVLSIVGQMTFMPILVLIANICPPGIEGVLYATMMSANNLSGNVGKLGGGLLTKLLGITNYNFDNLPLLIVITNLSGLIPLMFLHLIPDKIENKEK